MERAVESNLCNQLQGTCTLGRQIGFQPGPCVSITQFENIVTNREIIRMDVIPTGRRH